MPNHTHVFVDDDGDVAIIHHDHDESEHPHGQPDDISINQLMASGALEQTILVSDLPDVIPDTAAKTIVLQDDLTLGLSLHSMVTAYVPLTGQMQFTTPDLQFSVELGRTPDAYDLQGLLLPGASADTLICHRWGHMITIIGSGVEYGVDNKLCTLPTGFGISGYYTFTGYDDADKVVYGFITGQEIEMDAKNGGPWNFSINGIASQPWPGVGDLPPVYVP